MFNSKNCAITAQGEMPKARKRATRRVTSAAPAYPTPIQATISLFWLAGAGVTGRRVARGRPPMRTPPEQRLGPYAEAGTASCGSALVDFDLGDDGTAERERLLFEAHHDVLQICVRAVTDGLHDADFFQVGRRRCVAHDDLHLTPTRCARNSGQDGVRGGRAARDEQRAVGEKSGCFSIHWAIGARLGEEPS